MSKQRTRELSVTGTLVPNSTGKYRMSGWADIVKGLELRYEALAEMKVKGKRMRLDGTIDNDKLLSGDAVLSYIKTYYQAEPDIVEVRDNSVIMKVTGTMKSDFGLRASYTTEKVV